MNVPSFRFLVPPFLFLYPRSGFWYRRSVFCTLVVVSGVQETSAKTTIGNHPSQDDGKGGLGLRGVAFMTVSAVLTVLALLEITLPSLCLSYKMQCQETTMTALTALAVSAVVAVSVVTATPLKLNPPFSSS